jgi:hypothetical protein
VPPPPRVPEAVQGAEPPPPEAAAVPVPPPEPDSPPPQPASESPEIEVAPIAAAAPAHKSVPPPPPEEPEVPIPKPRGRAPRMVSLTLLDGTTITLPARKRKRDEGRPDSRPPVKRPGEDDVGLTARDLVAALRAVSHGADATEILGNNVRWEVMFAALLSLMLKKHLIADWEFVDEFKRI